ncbi:hypothetical protein OIU79_025376 [Salix purpurea]|uniref:Uncharacterized protein n=1 Tax=Salix purpurea TaxID=77065 RepID=A0A9Q0W5H3_SALPP|nr:hypothetical protein OIU79_025376 [Salix purpurea]
MLEDHNIKLQINEGTYEIKLQRHDYTLGAYLLEDSKSISVSI